MRLTSTHLASATVATGTLPQATTSRYLFGVFCRHNFSAVGQFDYVKNGICTASKGVMFVLRCDNCGRMKNHLVGITR